jgi:hypothetical protein
VHPIAPQRLGSLGVQLDQPVVAETDETRRKLGPVARRVTRREEHRPWLTALLARRPTKVTAIALANKIARMAVVTRAKRTSPETRKQGDFPRKTGRRFSNKPGNRREGISGLDSAELRQQGFYKAFPPPGIEVVTWYVMMGIGQVVTLRVPAERLREVNRAIEQPAARRELGGGARQPPRFNNCGAHQR